MLTQHTAQTTQAFFDAADRHFEDEEPLLAYENLWNAAAYALTAVADARGWPTDDPQDLKSAADRLANEARDHHLRHQFAVAQQFRRQVQLRLRRAPPTGRLLPPDARVR